MNKVKFEELLNDTTIVQDVLNDYGVEGISEHKLAQIEKKIRKTMIEELSTRAEDTLLAGDSVEVKNQFNVRPYARKETHEDGTPKMKLSLTMRSGLKNKLNPSSN